MEAAGYDVKIQPYTFTYTSFAGTPTWHQSMPAARDFTLVSDWNPGTSNGTADADMQPAGGIVLPPTASPLDARLHGGRLQQLYSGSHRAGTGAAAITARS